MPGAVNGGGEGVLWLGVDVGGTFTDAVLFDDETRAIAYAKAPSTPADPTDAVLDVLARMGVDLSRVARFVHGITIGTNAILEGKGADVWMLTTLGFRDVLEIARTNRPVLYDITTQKTPPIVPRTRVIEIDERLMFDGSVRRKLREAEVRRALRRIKTKQAKTGSGSGALVIGFLHSYANGAHEERARVLAEQALPGCF
ncbi:MAG: hydantoinase/oxoprolinase family protein, partial [Alphaproteobacteria bacterium]|nr:hydantoinase/oxoprolinase family protein [Alphaproteobacteria bacterium]